MDYHVPSEPYKGGGEQMKGLGNIFSFTFIQHIKQKGYRNVTVIVALLCLLLPAVIMPAIEYFKEDET